MRNLTLSLCLLSGLSLLSQPAAGALVSTYKSGLLDGMDIALSGGQHGHSGH